ncbi:MAG TPA: hypothetical protein VFC02_24925 [Anaerolineales bacterium]|nr:hypothetical protein [Anaerolineales bacterium]
MIGIIALAIVVAVLSPSNKPPPRSSIQESAWLACISLAKEQAKIDRIDAYIYSRYSAITLTEKDHYGVIVYTMDGRSYQCDLARQIGGSWFLKSLYIK